MYRKDNGTILLLGLFIKYCFGRLNRLWFEKRAEMVYGWFWLISKNAVEYNRQCLKSLIWKLATKVFAEYGNVGWFDYISKEGFGWVVHPANMVCRCL
jgi:hypothetical protein